MSNYVVPNFGPWIFCSDRDDFDKALGREQTRDASAVQFVSDFPTVYPCLVAFCAHDTPYPYVYHREGFYLPVDLARDFVDECDRLAAVEEMKRSPSG